MLHSGALSFLSTGILISAVRLLGRGSTFVAALVASRHLSTTNFGIYAYVITFLTAINLIGGLGLEQMALVALGRARASGSVSVLEGALSWIGGRAIFVLPIASAVFAWPIHAALGSSFALLSVILTGICLTAILLCASVLRGVDFPLVSTMVQETGRGPVFLLGALTLFYTHELVWVWVFTLLSALVFSLIAAAATIFTTRASQSALRSTTRLADGHNAALSFQGQLRFLLVLIATNAYLWACPVILKQSGAVKEVGLFNVAMQYPSLISFLSTSMEMMYVPKISTFWHAERLQDMRPFLRTGSRLTIVAGLPIIVILVIFGTPLLEIYGKGYSQTLPAMLIIAAAQIISVACGPCGYLVLLTGRERLNLFVMGISAVGGIICLAILARNYGHLAAALGFLVSTATSNIFFAGYCIKRMNINPTITAAWAPIEQDKQIPGPVRQALACNPENSGVARS